MLQYPNARQMKWVLLMFSSLLTLMLLLGSDLHSSSDGNDYVGFPFRFYSYFGGKRHIAFRHQFDLFALLADLLILLLLSLVALMRPGKKQ
ncbi:hypothetical protein [Arcticibacter sp. MXS-1]|uniref:hypothetical protein n=1 Tax=Arcticibacter sp. MXS-1 TaxID=3341726 RepID=UPI0035A93546